MESQLSYKYNYIHVISLWKLYYNIEAVLY